VANLRKKKREMSALDALHLRKDGASTVELELSLAHAEVFARENEKERNTGSGV
jgi:hypothetical protein